MNFGLGLHGPNLFPTETGRDYAPTPYLEALGKDVRDRMTDRERDVASGGDPGTRERFHVPHRRPVPRRAQLPELDLARSVPGREAQAGHAVPVAVAGDPQRHDFVHPLGRADPSRNEAVGGVRQDVRERVRGRRWPCRCAGSKDGQSVMDTVLGPARRLQDRVSAPDRERLDQYFTAVREVGAAAGERPGVGQEAEAEGGLRPAEGRGRPERRRQPAQADARPGPPGVPDRLHPVRDPVRRRVELGPADPGGVDRVPQPVSPRPGPGEAGSVEDHPDPADGGRGRLHRQAARRRRRAEERCSTRRR